MSKAANPLDGVEVYVFDVFGTVVDWYGSVTGALEASAPESLKKEGRLFFVLIPLPAPEVCPRTDWGAFTKEWRKGYGEYTCAQFVSTQRTIFHYVCAAVV